MVSPGFIAAFVLQEVRGSDQKVDGIAVRCRWLGKSSGNSLFHALASNGSGDYLSGFLSGAMKQGSELDAETTVVCPELHYKPATVVY